MAAAQSIKSYRYKSEVSINFFPTNSRIGENMVSVNTTVGYGCWSQMTKNCFDYEKSPGIYTLNSLSVPLHRMVKEEIRKEIRKE